METHTVLSIIEVCALIILGCVTLGSNMSGDALWVMPLVIVCFIFWVIWLLIREDDLKKQTSLQKQTIEMLEEQNTRLRKNGLRSVGLSRHAD